MAARPQRRHLAILAGLAIAGIAAACTPVTPPPPLPPQPSPPKPASAPSPSCFTGTAATELSNSFVAVVHDVNSLESPEVYTFKANTEQERQAAVAELEATGDVVSVERDGLVEALAVNPADDPSYGQQWGLPKVGFNVAWAAGSDGSGVTIAVVDSGVDAQHTDLAGRVLPGMDFICGVEGTATDPHSHGTHVAGIAAAADNTAFGLGGAPAASILPVRVLSASGSGSFSDVAAGIYWAVDHGADVINMSLGGGSASTTMEDALVYAHDHGVTVVAAAGNNGSATPSYPAAFDGLAIAVAATDSNNALASFSNFGSYVDIAAPGVAIYSTLPKNGFGTKSGTSMSSPFVAAAVALMLENCPGLNPDAVLVALQTYADPSIAGLGKKLVDVDNAVANAC